MPRIRQTGHAQQIDFIIGQRVRIRRLQLRMTQEELGEEVALSYQQVQKYELGKDRMSVSRMLDIADVLKVDPCYFIKDLGSSKDMPFLSKDELKLVLAFSNIADSEIKKDTLKLVLSMLKASAA